MISLKVFLKDTMEQFLPMVRLDQVKLTVCKDQIFMIMIKWVSFHDVYKLFSNLSVKRIKVFNTKLKLVYVKYTWKKSKIY